MFGAKWRLPWDEEWTTSGIVFETEEDAALYLHRKYGYLFDNEGSFKFNTDIFQIEVFQKPKWWGKQPFFAEIIRGHLGEVRPYFDDSMLKESFIPKNVPLPGGNGVSLRFWAVDQEAAEQFAKSFYEGWKAGFISTFKGGG